MNTNFVLLRDVATMVYSEGLLQDLSVDTEENHKYLNQVKSSNPNLNHCSLVTLTVKLLKLKQILHLIYGNVFMLIIYFKFLLWSSDYGTALSESFLSKYMILSSF
jgi:hypothetical protein